MIRRTPNFCFFDAMIQLAEMQNELTLLRNRGELAEGWYEPETLRKAQASAALVSRTAAKNQMVQDDVTSGGDLSDDDVGPALPVCRMTSDVGSERRGPAIPSLQDLELQRGNACIYFFYSNL